MRKGADQLAEEMLVSLLAEAPEEYLGAEAICGKLGLPQDRAEARVAAHIGGLGQDQHDAAAAGGVAGG